MSGTLPCGLVDASETKAPSLEGSGSSQFEPLLPRHGVNDFSISSLSFAQSLVLVLSHAKDFYF